MGSETCGGMAIPSNTTQASDPLGRLRGKYRVVGCAARRARKLILHLRLANQLALVLPGWRLPTGPCCSVSQFWPKSAVCAKWSMRTMLLQSTLQCESS